MSNATRFGIVIASVALAWMVAYWLTPGAEPAAATGEFPSNHQPQLTFSETAPRPGNAPDGRPVARFPGSHAADASGDDPLAADSPHPAEPEAIDDPLDAAAADSRDVPDADPAPRPGPDDSFEIVPPEFFIHVVRRGDTPDSISRLYYGTRKHWDAILRANPLDDLHRRLRVGMEIRVPKDPNNVQGLPRELVDRRETDPEPDADDPGPVEFLEYRVKKGDTLTEIAFEIYGKASLWTLIRDANPKVGDDGTKLREGMSIRIPPKPAGR